ncbi:hypothetical protein [Armatimonas rosea]|uniref:Uncharacterized protein n=1 Tax=Armatimonas rosea TaxID=685828 RepID=A0A7W9W6U1_ARMRO|nr:hypothetical protein [Armatimonas rosea]MBB6051799.1 hypothetical protein [Armatimonas rosea]
MDDNFSPESLPWVCFSCRKAFRKPVAADGPFPCPSCRQPLQFMGAAFQAPRKTATRQWTHLATLYQAGVRFQHRNGATGARTASDLAAQLTEQRRDTQTEAERILAISKQRKRRQPTR